MKSWTVSRSRTENPEFESDQLMMTIFDLFGAGADTTSSTLAWAVLFLCLHPELQERCHQEVREHTGSEEVRLDQARLLNLCQAFMAEVQRHGQVAVGPVMHRLTTQVVENTRTFERPPGNL